ncbi:MAG: L-threonylcarbamoyladenylate synthase [Smithellaceae bacterium]|nr:L-threonylcarbamoyladenylate synthase [Smithellaceae bacterium]
MTVILKIKKTAPDEDKIARAARVIKEGGLVAFPTETVYGLGADAFNPAAIEKIFIAKGRPRDNPLIVHIADRSMLANLARSFPRRARALSEKFWPGPLTLVLKKKAHVPAEVSAGLSTVAIRMPANPIALSLIRAAGTPLVAPSANLSGRPSPTRARHVREDLGGLIDLIIDGGSTPIGMESTVVDFTGRYPKILRPGAVTAAQIEAIIGPVIPAGEREDTFQPKSPGMKYRHYAPRARMILVEGEDFREKICTLITEAGRERKIAVIGFHQDSRYDNCLFVHAGARSRTVARRLFGILRELDSQGVELIISEPYPARDGLDLMILDRLRKAAGAEG